VQHGTGVNLLYAIVEIGSRELGLENQRVRVTEMDLPDDKGTYVLIASVPQMKRVEVGKLGKFDIVPGFYAYVGSAFGAGGLGARIGHHLESAAAAHWHIDYLLQVAKPVEVWYTVANQELEHHWADLLEQAPQFRIPIPRFGSSDYHRSRASHLFYSKRRPAFGWFQQQLSEKFEEVHAERYLLPELPLEVRKPGLGVKEEPG
jgi:Uri superfamily endonuclease